MQLCKNQKQSKSFLKWITAPEQLSRTSPFLKAKPLIINNAVNMDQFLFEVQNQQKKYQIKRSSKQIFDMSNGQQYNDMCQMSIINQPQILFNLIKRYKKHQIFTYIGLTLILINPYTQIKDLFDKNALLKYKQKIQQRKFDYQNPHLFMVAGKAFDQIKFSKKAQTIIISGQSGAGKTQSTKYCLEILTSLSVNNQNNISEKILFCNPILQAFGNSKTVKNDNSSRFGKFLKIFFDSQNLSILGAKIDTYLLEKSRIVNVSKDQRNFHCFYALIESKKFQTLNAQKYQYLNKSKEYKCTYINDAQNFQEVNQAMKKVGFTCQDIDKIWSLLKCILQIGNIQIQDSNHNLNQSQPCSIKNKEILKQICKTLQLQVQHFLKLVLYQKRKFLKEQLLIPYDKNSCRSNLDTLSKQIYNKIFQYILKIINLNLAPNTNITNSAKKQITKFKKQINILDIFGFQNFENNSLEQMCINFANQKLLKLYSQYVFQKQIQILKQDGILTGLQLLKPASTNIIEILSGKTSIFSIVNQLTLHKQFTDQHMLQSIKKQIKDQKIGYCKKRKELFSIQHSQCLVQYKISDFKQKNQDKVNDQIIQIVETLFDLKKMQKLQQKTVLNKFSLEMKSLMNHIEQSSVHFIRCIKPNQQKKPLIINQHYLLKQIRYLGIFQTIKIRQKSFPVRKTHQQFQNLYQEIYKKKKYKNAKQFLQSHEDLKQDRLFKIGKKRIYLSIQLDMTLTKIWIDFLKQKQLCAVKLQRQYRVYKYRKNIQKNLKILIQKVRGLKLISKQYEVRQIRNSLLRIKEYCKQKQNKKKQQKQKALEYQSKQLLKRRKALIDEHLNKILPILENVYNKNLIISFLRKINFFYSQNFNLYQQKTIYQSQIQSQSKITPKQYQSNLNDNYNSQQSHWSVSQINQIEQPYKIEQIQKKDKKEESTTNFPNQYFNYNSLALKDQSIIYKSNLKVKIFDLNQNIEGLQKLKGKKQSQNVELQEDKKKYTTSHLNFQQQKMNQYIHKQIISFQESQFMQKYMRTRKNFFGKQKKFKEIFNTKHQPLKKSLTKLSEQNQIETLKLHKQILKLLLQGSIQFVLQVIQNFLSMCLQKDQQVKNQVFLLLLKESNSKIYNFSFCVFQLFLCFLHVFQLSQQFLIAGLYVLLCRHAQKQNFDEHIQELLKCTVNRIMLKLQQKSSITYFPSKYQLFSLMCNKCIETKIHLPLGSSVKIICQPTDTLKIKKQKILSELGINTSRINKDYFQFIQVVSFQNQQIEQIPLSQNEYIWDVKASWQLAQANYKKNKLIPPSFFIMVKLMYPFQLQIFDQEGIQLFFNQCMFDLFAGRIILDSKDMIELATYIALIKKIKLKPESAFLCFPIWYMQKYGLQKAASSLADSLYQKQKTMKQQSLDLYLLKGSFIKICEKSPLSMSLNLPTQSQLNFFLKPRRLYITDKSKSQILEQYQLKFITKWGVDNQKFYFQIKKQSGQNNKKTYVFFTQYAHFFGHYFKKLKNLI